MPCIVIYFYSKTNGMYQFLNLFYFLVALYMFRTVFPSIIRSLYIALSICQTDSADCLLASMKG